MNRTADVNLLDGSCIRVTRTSDFSDDGRREYRYAIRDAAGHLLVRGQNLRGPVNHFARTARTSATIIHNEDPTSQEMLGTLLGFLVEAAAHYRHNYMSRHDDGTYEPRFDRRTDEWAYANEDELNVLSEEMSS